MPRDHRHARHDPIDAIIPLVPDTLPLTPIRAIQGSGLLSPMAGQTVRTRGVVTGHSRKGYFVQDPVRSQDPLVSDAVFVYSPGRKARVGLHLELEGRVLDYVKGGNGRPTTQLKAFEAKLRTQDAIMASCSPQVLSEIDIWPYLRRIFFTACKRCILRVQDIELDATRQRCIPVRLYHFTCAIVNLAERQPR